MSEPFLGMIAIYGFNFAPRGWAFCNGQILPIAQNTALFSLLGTTYGGNGQTTFALPDLRGRWPNHFGQGPGLSSYDLGQVGGTESVTLTGQQIPAHTHTVACVTGAGTAAKVANNLLSNLGIDPPPTTANVYSNAAASGQMSPSMIPPSGGGNQPHTIIQPYLTLNFCIALEGIFPSRN
ncbi:MAG TPA: tail fiber protein [Blastocatellia bacterium]|nr:tail fiber protein [Blastocatellia bacterium]